MQQLTDEQEFWLQSLETTDLPQNYNGLLHHLTYGYCCLGIYAKDRADKVREDQYRTVYEGKALSLSNRLTDKLGLYSNTGRFRNYETDPASGAKSLIHLNDKLRWPFKRIAAFIRKNPELVFIPSSEK